MVHKQTQTLIDLLLSEAPQALLLTGQRGVGLLSVARMVASTQLVVVVQPSEETVARVISVEQIRRLYSETKSKSNSRQFVIIDEADRMTRAAQTAFLKLLEEPAKTVHFILVTDKPSSLLQTITSRVQRYNVKLIANNQSLKLIADLGVTDKVKVQQLLYIAAGLPEELEKLATDEVYFQAAAQRIKDARELLQASPYDKLVLAHTYKGDREQAIELIRSAIIITRRSLSQRPQQTLVRQLERLLNVEEALLGNQNIRLQMAHLVV